MITLFKANPRNTGALVSFKFTAKSNKKGEPFKEGAVYVSLVKQVSWNESNKTGSFSGGSQTSIKLSPIEVGRFIRVLEKDETYNTVHRSDSGMTIIDFKPYVKNGEFKGYGLAINKNTDGEKESFMVGIGLGEDVQVREFLKLALEHIHLAAYAEEKRRTEEYYESKNSKGGAAKVVESVDSDEGGADSSEDDDDSLFG
jgi:hypothetical protein